MPERQVQKVSKVTKEEMAKTGKKEKLVIQMLIKYFLKKIERKKNK